MSIKVQLPLLNLVAQEAHIQIQITVQVATLTPIQVQIIVQAVALVILHLPPFLINK